MRAPECQGDLERAGFGTISTSYGPKHPGRKHTVGATQKGADQISSFRIRHNFVFECDDAGADVASIHHLLDCSSFPSFVLSL